MFGRAYRLSNVKEAEILYDEWAATYDAEMRTEGQNYVGPAVASEYVIKHIEKLGLKREDVRVLDAGCGTGLVGIHLANSGVKNIDGVDLSAGMLDVARKTGAYQGLETADLSKPIAQQTSSYDVVVCVGTLTEGHVGPIAIAELVRLVKRPGVFVATILDKIWESGGYAAEVSRLASEGKIELVSNEIEDYRRGAGVRARMLVLKSV